MRRRGREVPLKLREFALLAFLLRHPGRVFTRAQLLAQVWPVGDRGAYVGDPRTVDVHVHRLREKLERDPRRPKLLETVRGVGYRLRTPALPTPPRARPPTSTPPTGYRQTTNSSTDPNAVDLLKPRPKRVTSRGKRRSPARNRAPRGAPRAGTGAG